MNLEQLVDLDRHGVAAIDVPEYAEIVGVSRATGFKAVRRGDVQAVRVSKRWRVLVKPLLRQLGVVEVR